MQSFRSFGLLLEEQWPAEGPEMARRPFSLHRSPHQCSGGAPNGLKLCMRGFLDAPRRLAPFVLSFDAVGEQWPDLGLSRNENLGQNLSNPCDLATKTAANGAETWHGSSPLLGGS